MHIWAYDPYDYIDNVPLSYQGIAINLETKEKVFSKSFKKTLKTNTIYFNLIDDIDGIHDDNIVGDFKNYESIYKKIVKLSSNHKISEDVLRWKEKYEKEHPEVLLGDSLP
jgi:hypothetical protein